jgi:hypothetical protein
MTLPDFLTVVEAAKALRIGRTVAYEQATLYELTGGAEGLPVIRIGRQLRVPRAQLEAMAGGPLSESPAPVPADPPRRLHSVRDEPANQAALPFGS